MLTWHGGAKVTVQIEPSYVKIAQRRIKELRTGTLKTKPLNQPIHVLGENDAVARVPVQWMKKSQARSAEVVR